MFRKTILAVALVAVVAAFGTGCKKKEEKPAPPTSTSQPGALNPGGDVPISKMTPEDLEKKREEFKKKLAERRAKRQAEREKTLTELQDSERTRIEAGIKDGSISGEEAERLQAGLAKAAEQYKEANADGRIDRREMHGIYVTLGVEDPGYANREKRREEMEAKRKAMGGDMLKAALQKAIQNGNVTVTSPDGEPVELSTDSAADAPAEAAPEGEAPPAE